ncbi:hypothetical protein [Pelotalea chapellei]|uniref:Uncharacterized protein n=1 Tax=Pelotalea chapellei TaxID=44671 RepID=A0ABS5U769_9BACT|nr:hypothetical protein [Pelotalea chapellei]MBT1071515.1 hypothetical protein [Pelotalea chapellei]
MESATMEDQVQVRRSYFPGISWGAITGGLVSGMAIYIVFALFGLAAGLTPVKTLRPSETMQIVSSVWTSISFIVSAFVGGYVSARMSGLSRLADGILHGLVVWGVSTLVFTFLLTTPLGSLVGGNFALVGQEGGIVAGKGAVGAEGTSRLQWGLFFGVLFSMGLGMFGGAIGSRAAVKRRIPISNDRGSGMRQKSEKEAREGRNEKPIWG